MLEVQYSTVQYSTGSRARGGGLWIVLVGGSLWAFGSSNFLDVTGEVGLVGKVSPASKKGNKPTRYYCSTVQYSTVQYSRKNTVPFTSWHI
jgi:hypothetical protein